MAGLGRTAFLGRPRPDLMPGLRLLDRRPRGLRLRSTRPAGRSASSPSRRVRRWRPGCAPPRGPDVPGPPAGAAPASAARLRLLPLGPGPERRAARRDRGQQGAATPASGRRRGKIDRIRADGQARAQRPRRPAALDLSDSFVAPAPAAAGTSTSSLRERCPRFVHARRARRHQAQIRCRPARLHAAHGRNSGLTSPTRTGPKALLSGPRAREPQRSRKARLK